MQCIHVSSCGSVMLHHNERSVSKGLQRTLLLSCIHSRLLRLRLRLHLGLLLLLLLIHNVRLHSCIWLRLRKMLTVLDLLRGQRLLRGLSLLCNQVT